MVDYKVFCFDGAGRLWIDDWIVADTDEEAISAAGALKDAVTCEVWRRDRLVATVKNGRAIYGNPRPIA